MSCSNTGKSRTGHLKLFAAILKRMTLNSIQNPGPHPIYAYDSIAPICMWVMLIMPCRMSLINDIQECIPTHFL